MSDKLYSTQRLLEAVRERGHEPVLVDYRHCNLIIEQGKPSVRYKGTDLNDIGGAPAILKLLESSLGKGVIKADSINAAKSTIEAFSGIKKSIIIQEFIEEANGADIRVFIVNGEIVGSMKRQGKEGDFRSNLHRGGTAEPTELSKT